VLFDFCTSRAGEHARRVLKGFDGTVLSDDFAGYNALFAQGVTEAGCMAHCRRKLFEANKLNGSQIAGQAVALITKLYEIEDAAKDMTPEERRQLRQQRAKPITEELHTWLTGQRQRLAKADATAKAIDHTLGRWRALMRYLDDGNVPIGRVEMWRGGGRSRHRCFRPFRLAVPYEPDRGSVSTSPSSNRTCATNASGSLPTHQAFAFERSRAAGIRRISLNFS
jgi:hypothetical protein